MEDIDIPFEEWEIRCPKLGGPVTFSYCCVEAVNLPCSRAIRCWCERFNVELFFRRKLGNEKYGMAFEQPQPTRLENILELIDRAKRLRLENPKKSK
ncbi:MAG: hypothetical protein ACP5VS_10780 [Desulfomonilaceae bacterium]